MKESDIDVILQGAKEKYAGAKPKDHLRQRTAVRGPRFEGVHLHLGHDPRAHFPVLPANRTENWERWHKSLKRECIRPLTPLTLDDGMLLIETYVDYCNTPGDF
jgi:putative transposase